MGHRLRVALHPRRASLRYLHREDGPRLQHTAGTSHDTDLRVDVGDRDVVGTAMQRLHRPHLEADSDLAATHGDDGCVVVWPRHDDGDVG